MNGAQGKIGGPSLGEVVAESIFGILFLFITVFGLGAVAFLVTVSILSWTMPDCPTEDSHNCYWDGGPNNQGAEFLDLFDGAVFIVTDDGK